MMTLEEIRNTIAPELEALARRIDSALGSGNQLMNSVVEGYLKSKGKMIRPILVILTAKMLGEVNDRVMVRRCRRGAAPQRIADPRRCDRRVEDAPRSANRQQSVGQSHSGAGW